MADTIFYVEWPRGDAGLSWEATKGGKEGKFAKEGTWPLHFHN